MLESTLALLLLAWVGCLVWIAVLRWRRSVGGSGLVFAYLLSLWLSHWLGGSIYLFSWYNFQDWRLVQTGLQQSLYAVAAFALGSTVIAPFLLGLRPFPEGRRGSVAPDPALAKIYIATGALAYTALLTSLGRLPTVTSLIAAAQQLLVVGLCLACWHAWCRRRGGELATLLLVTALLPFATIVLTGFLGYGAVAAMVVYVFVSGFVRPRWKVVAGCVVVTYVGLSFYVSYMRDRGEIREVVWGGRPLDERVEQVVATVREIEWFDPGSEAHLFQIDHRLNQNGLLGLAVERLARGDTEYAYGQTVIDSVLALVPRAVWPDKPVFAGSGDLVSRYTGVRFAEGTSVGIGQVMELYVNFATTGIVVGFLLLGTVITILDQRARECLDRGDWKAFALWYLPGVAMLQTGGALAEVTAAAAASIVATLAVNRFLRHGLFRNRWAAPVRPSAAPTTRALAERP
jgi:hypothetical protein